MLSASMSKVNATAHLAPFGHGGGLAISFRFAGMPNSPCRMIIFSRAHPQRLLLRIDGLERVLPLTDARATGRTLSLSCAPVQACARALAAARLCDARRSPEAILAGYLVRSTQVLRQKGPPDRRLP